jgi:hypothetical protein
VWAVVTGVIYCALAFEIRGTTQALAKATDVTERDAAQLAGRLAQLHAEGMLSTEEYTQLRASLLATHTSARVGHGPRGAASSGP